MLLWRNTTYQKLLSYLSIIFLLLIPVTQSYASELLADITSRLVKASITQGTFQQEKQLKILSRPLMSSGLFTYDQSKGVIWQTLAPVPSLLLVNESQLISGQGEQNVPAAFGKVFKALLGGDLHELTESFLMTGENKNNTWQLQLTPTDEFLQKIISTITLRGDSELRALELQEVTGNFTRISFTQITHPNQLGTEQEADFERLSP
jgi:hypothetical protein